MFNQAAIANLMSSISSEAKALGIFQAVLRHEPKSAPTHDLTFSFFVDTIKPSKIVSGLNATAGVVVLKGRIYISFLAKPEDEVEAKILNAASVLINGFSGEFTLGASVIAVDLIGMDSPGLSAQMGYTTIDNKVFRVCDLTIPVIIDNLWNQVA